MSAKHVIHVLVIFLTAMVAILVSVVSAIAADPIPGYIAQINSSNLVTVATELVTQYGPRREDTYTPYIDGNCTFGDTVYPKTTIEMSADYVKALFEAMGYPSASITVEQLPGNAGQNVYVTKLGSTYPNVYIEFSGHMDTVPDSPGGADNASGSTAVIELARVLKDYPNRYSMRFILWAAEEYSVQRGVAYYGSSYHVQQALARGEQIKAGLVMDHIGWPYPSDPTGYMNEISYNGSDSERIADLFNQVRTDYGIVIGYGKDQAIQNSDEHSYWNFGQTAVSSGGGWLYYRPNYHSCGDTLSNIDFTNVLRVAQQNLAVGLNLDAETFPPASPTATPTGTVVSATPTPTNTPVSPGATPTATSVPPANFPSTEIIDDFNRADGPLGTNWSGDTAGYSIIANQLDVGSTEDIYWNSSSFGADQEVFVNLTTIDPNSNEIGMVLKSQTQDGFSPGLIEVLYNPIANSVQTWTFQIPEGWIQRGTSIPITFTDGDQFGARAGADGRVEVYRNGALLGTIDVTAWPHYANGGFIGLFNINASNAILDNFGGGTVGTVPTPSPTNTPTPTATNTPLPPNTPPVANNDAYSVNENAVLSVAAPGVLSNDSDADGDGLTAVVNVGPSNGTLTLNGDGSFSYTPNADFSGVDTFTYHASDGPLDSNVATVSITVNAVNDPPVANDDTGTVEEGGTLNVAAPGVLGNDSDPENDTLTVSTTPVIAPANGGLTLNADGSYTYTHNGSETDTDSFVYEVCDLEPLCDTATVNLTITAVNDPPVANSDTYVTDEGVSLNVGLAQGVLVNDTDPESDLLSAVLVSDVSNGSLTLNSDGSFSYTPNANFSGVDTFTYHANDGSLDSNVATVSITVNAVNDPPVADDLIVTTDEDTAVAISLVGSDPDNDPLTFSVVSGPTDGTLSGVPPNLTYTPDFNHTGLDSFTYKANDGTVDSNIATVSITVSAVNDAPVAGDDAYSVNENAVLSVAAPGVLSNDSDPDGDGLTAVLVSSVSHGTLTLNSDGSLDYTPEANFSGTDTFTYSAYDGTASSTIATVMITVNPVNDAPVAVDDTYTTSEDTLLSVAAPGVLSNDSDSDGDTLTAVLVSDVSHGMLSLSADGSLDYTPEANFNGTDTFTYHANDGSLDSNVATVTITVNPVNDAPVAVDDAYTTDEDVTLSVLALTGVLSNDSDPDGDGLTAVLVSSVSNGTLTLNADGSFDYTPNANFNGTDTFTYHANDGLLDSNVATVSITASAVNDAPVAVDDAYTTDEDVTLSINAPGVLSNDSDLDGDTLTAVLVSGVSHGTLTLNSDGSLDYTPEANFNGTDTFTYHASDGSLDSNAATVSITVSAVNDAPVANDDSYTTDEDTSLNVTLPGVLGDDSDPDGDTLTAVLVSGVSHGTLTLNGDGSFDYTPETNFSGTDTFTYHASDGSLDSNVATVSITVSAVNDAPVANDDSYTTDEDTNLTVTAPGVLSNDSDPDGDGLTAVLVSSVSNGTLTLNADGSFDYTPNANFSGVDTFTYRANDGSLDSNVATVSITVNPGTTIIDEPAASEIFEAGTVSGAYTDTYLNDGITELIAEQESGGKPATRYSYLEHKWIFNITSGNVVTLYANAWRTVSSDGDSFVFAYSTDDVTYLDMFSVESISDDNLLATYILPPAIQGTVYIRVTDTDHTIGNRFLDTIFVDQLYIRSETQPGNPPAAPSDLTATAISVSQINLFWADNATDEDGFYIERSEDNSTWILVDTSGADVTTYTDPTVFPSTTYYYRIQAYNGSGSSHYSNTAAVTTPNGLNLTGIGYKIKGLQMVDLIWSGGNATSFDVYRDGNLIASDITGNAYTDNIGLKGSGIYQYQVCAAGSLINCSNIIQIIF
jgi:VCBS repeat-containing protein